MISSSASGANSVVSADLDNDGHMDVVASQQDNNRIVWFKGDGAGSFGAEQTVTTSCNGCRQVFVADLNDDGFMDIIGAEGSSKTVSIFINPQTGPTGVIADAWWVPFPGDLTLFYSLATRRSHFTTSLRPPLAPHRA